ncbi:uncharacterized protein LOC111078066 [Drosophila obscura]|uniref:uncharacterized protein LOC111078066 n=1 Tax=Drosophila obscura TaxID=7282 RepID=UPI000B9FFD04|nr:uncharacterized protein LOC111078066 [Drosophila obscura]
MLSALKLQRSERIQKTMRDDKEILLDGESYLHIIQIDEPENVSNEEQIPAEMDIVEDEPRSYRFLHNWNTVGICLFYNLCMIVLLVLIFIYKRKN